MVDVQLTAEAVNLENGEAHASTVPPPKTTLPKTDEDGNPIEDIDDLNSPGVVF